MPPKKSKGKSKGGHKRKRNDSIAKNPFHFDLNVIHRKLESEFDGEVDAKATVYLAAVLQYVAAEIIEISGNKAREHQTNKKTFVIREEDIQNALNSDEELKKLHQECTEKAEKK